MRKRFLLILLLLLAIVFCVPAYYYFAYQGLTVSEYQIPAKVTAPIRIVHLSDLHNREFGEDNIELISLVADQKPDLILITGDMLNRDEEDVSVITALLPRLADIAPVYYKVMP